MGSKENATKFRMFSRLLQTVSQVLQLKNQVFVFPVKGWDQRALRLSRRIVTISLMVCQTLCSLIPG